MNAQPEALLVADELLALFGPTEIDERAAAELRRLHSEVERKSDAIQRVWKERDELRAEASMLREQNTMLDAKIAELEQEQEQEPVGQLQEESYGRGQVMWFNKPPDQTMLYTAPQRREWVSVSDDEIYGMYDEPRSDSEMVAFARNLEAALKERNA